MPVKSVHAKVVRHGEANDAALIERLRAAAELLETVSGNRSLLMELSEEERMRLLTAAGEIYCPDVRERRRLVKATSRRRKADRLQRSETVLAETGIRKLRREKVFTTPNLSPPPDFEPQEVDGRSRFPRSRRAAELLHLQKGLFARSTISTTSFVRRARS